MRVVVGCGRDEEVIGLIRLGTAQISVSDCAAWSAQFLPEKERVSDTQLGPAQQRVTAGSERPCLQGVPGGLESKFHDSFLL